MRSLAFIFIVVLVLFPRPAVAASAPVAAAAQDQADRAAARLEKLREAYQAGAVSKRELEEAEAELRLARRRLRDASTQPGKLDLNEARIRVEEARGDFERASEKAGKLQLLHEAGAAARNDLAAALAAVEQSRVLLELTEELARRVEAVASLPARPASPAAPPGFSIAAFFALQDDYYREFQRPLPVSAFGPSETHERLGFDHDGRVDIALHPDSSEGQWLIAQLRLRGIPFIPFRDAEPGKATGAHIHMGFPSPVISRTS